jgi:hypothetical protein
LREHEDGARCVEHSEGVPWRGADEGAGQIEEINKGIVGLNEFISDLIFNASLFYPPSYVFNFALYLHSNSTI